jgi:hypothetical protein
MSQTGRTNPQGAEVRVRIPNGVSRVLHSTILTRNFATRAPGRVHRARRGRKILSIGTPGRHPWERVIVISRCTERSRRVENRTIGIGEREAENWLLLPIFVQCPLVFINLFGGEKSWGLAIDAR